MSAEHEEMTGCRTILFCASSEKYETIRNESKELWRCQRFWLVIEFEERSWLPPPFAIPLNIFEIIKSLYQCCKKPRKVRVVRQTARKITVQAWTLDDEYSSLDALGQRVPMTSIDQHSADDTGKVVGIHRWAWVLESILSLHSSQSPSDGAWETHCRNILAMYIWQREPEKSVSRGEQFLGGACF